jgi:hypothetical protein
MKPTHLRTKSTLALALAGILAIGPAMAEKPSWAGSGKSNHEERTDKRENDKRENTRHERRDADERSSRDGGRREHFEDRHHVVVREYYDERYRSGRCPPGLAKKHNGCMPPGQAKKWHIGQPLARDVVFYPVPQQLVVQFGQPPSGYRYVRVASDILLMAVGTGMVVDAIQNLGRL